MGICCICSRCRVCLDFKQTRVPACSSGKAPICFEKSQWKCQGVEVSKHSSLQCLDSSWMCCLFALATLQKIYLKKALVNSGCYGMPSYITITLFLWITDFKILSLSLFFIIIIVLVVAIITLHSVHWCLEFSFVISTLIYSINSNLKSVNLVEISSWLQGVRVTFKVCYTNKKVAVSLH